MCPPQLYRFQPNQFQSFVLRLCWFVPFIPSFVLSRKRRYRNSVTGEGLKLAPPPSPISTKRIPIVCATFVLVCAVYAIVCAVTETEIQILRYGGPISLRPPAITDFNQTNSNRLCYVCAGLCRLCHCLCCHGNGDTETPLRERV